MNPTLEQYRYPGTRPFTENDKLVFFGRDDDIERLHRLVIVEKLIVLFGKSGLGKSSLLNAGVVPKLKKGDDFYTMPIRVGLVDGENKTPSAVFLNKIKNQIEYNNFLWEKIVPQFKNQWANDDLHISFWLACKSLQIQHPNRTLVFIFDQFEELFGREAEDIIRFSFLLSTILHGQTPQTILNKIIDNHKVEKGFLTKKEIAAISEPLQIKMVISIRSDRMSLLNRMKTHIPQILQKTYELLPLNIKQAEDALQKPARAEGEFISPPFQYGPKASEKIIDFLSSNREKSIEAFQLQLICQFCEKLIVERKGKPDFDNTIHAADLADLGDLDTIFIRHYEEIIEKISDDDVQRLEVRRLIEEKMIVEGSRVPLPDIIITSTYKIPKELLQSLVNSRLLRCEPNTTGGYSYEISHDTLVEPITALGNLRKEQEEKELEMVRRMREILKEKERNERENQEKIERLKEKSEQARRRWILRFLVAVIALVLAGLGFAIWQIAETTKLKNHADIQKQNAITFLKQELASKGIIADDLFGYFLSEAERKYGKGLYTDANNDYNRARLLAEDAQQESEIQTRLSEIDTIQKFLLQAGKFNTQKNFTAAIQEYEEILAINPTDTITPFRIEFAQMLIDGYMVEVPGGTFTMGDNSSGQWDETEHEVSLDTFYMGKYEVSQNLFLKVMGWNRSYFDDNPENPGESVSWYDAVECCNRLSELMGLKPWYNIKKNERSSDYNSEPYLVEINKNASGFRLPTEAEWEYAAGWDINGRMRWAGTNNENELKNYANYDTTHTIPVGSLRPNPLGLYDMSGNVWEWCWDWYDGEYYEQCRVEGIIENPCGPVNGSFRVLRGGSWSDIAHFCRSAPRFGNVPGNGWSRHGFRLLFAFQFTSEPDKPGKILSE
ncbi:MAG: SUMF1/EgtB/PvdO family nonheme iron enzyme [Bacteroidales bacterium]|nr:SUMF1/EgtB/PvdO family nonheme iron enzyme [Bacteroidales bacterium]